MYTSSVFPLRLHAFFLKIPYHWSSVSSLTHRQTIAILNDRWVPLIQREALAPLSAELDAEEVRAIRKALETGRWGRAYADATGMLYWGGAVADLFLFRLIRLVLRKFPRP